MSIEDEIWREYEKEIHQELASVFTDCEFEFDDKILLREKPKKSFLSTLLLAIY